MNESRDSEMHFDTTPSHVKERVSALQSNLAFCTEMLWLCTECFDPLAFVQQFYLGVSSVVSDTLTDKQNEILSPRLLIGRLPVALRSLSSISVSWLRVSTGSW